MRVPAAALRRHSIGQVNPSQSLLELADFALAHETPWPRDPAVGPAPGQQPFGVHHGDPEPFNRVRGPLHVRGGPAGVVWQHGRELLAWGDPERADQTFSVAKTCLALLAGVAHARVLLPDVHEPVVRRVPGIGFDAGTNAEVTWEHLLQQTSEWEGSCLGVPDQVDRWRHVAHDPRPAAAQPKGGARPLHRPGTYWEYNDVRINQLALALLHLFGRPLPEVLGEVLMTPLGARSRWAWQGYDDAWVTVGGRRVQSVPGGTHWGGGLSIGARDLARLGQLLLDDGRIGPVGEGRGPIDAAWVRRMRSPCTIAPFYGYLVWLNVTGSLFPAASAEAFAMLGAGGHLVLMEPALHAVVVARWLDPAATAEFVQKAVTALRPTAR
ncbi:MAG: serine hydrolase [Burkholderiales bacterium]|nr:serine hydrolase [Burkholderiales bacterium]